MRKEFPEHFPKSEAHIKNMWQECLFVVDANILLNLYRYSDDSREAFKKVLDSIKDRLWIPHRAAEEFFRNRVGVIGQQEAAYDGAIGQIDSLQEDLEDKLNSMKHPFVPRETKETVEKAFKELKKDLADSKKAHEARVREDPILAYVGELFAGRVGKPYAKEEETTHIAEGERRYAAKIPPGYQDEKKDHARKYGDYLVWCQLLDHAKSQDSSVIFITDDSKEDWWLEARGKTLGPRTELVREFLDKTNQAFHMYQAGQFLKRANEYLNQATGEDALEEIREMQTRSRDIVAEGRASLAEAKASIAEAKAAMEEMKRVRDARHWPHRPSSRLNRLERVREETLAGLESLRKIGASAPLTRKQLLLRGKLLRGLEELDAHIGIEKNRDLPSDPSKDYSDIPMEYFDSPVDSTEDSAYGQWLRKHYSHAFHEPTEPEQE